MLQLSTAAHFMKGWCNMYIKTTVKEFVSGAIYNEIGIFESIYYDNDVDCIALSLTGLNTLYIPEIEYSLNSMVNYIYDSIASGKNIITLDAICIDVDDGFWDTVDAYSEINSQFKEAVNDAVAELRGE